MEKTILFFGIAAFLLLFLAANFLYSNASSTPPAILAGYSCFDISDRVSLRDNVITFSGKSCLVTLNSSFPRAKSYTTDGSILELVNKLVFGETCDNMEVEISPNLQNINPEKQGVFQGADGKLFWCDGKSAI